MIYSAHNVNWLVLLPNIGTFFKDLSATFMFLFSALPSDDKI